MKKLEATIISPYTKAQIIETINGQITKKPKLKHLNNYDVFHGSVSDEKIELKTVTSPPIEINGDLVTGNSGSTTLNIIIKTDSMKKALIGMSLALLFPVVFVVGLLVIIDDPKNILNYIVTIACFPIIYFMTKFAIAFMYNEPDPNISLRKLVKLVDGKLVEKNKA
ncbi:MAG: hypothetical protein JXR05_17485 [Flavobacteriaceae bacterium]